MDFPQLTTAPNGSATLPRRLTPLQDIVPSEECTNPPVEAEIEEDQENPWLAAEFTYVRLNPSARRLSGLSFSRFLKLHRRTSTFDRSVKCALLSRGFPDHAQSLASCHVKRPCLMPCRPIFSQNAFYSAADDESIEFEFYGVGCRNRRWENVDLCRLRLLCQKIRGPPIRPLFSPSILLTEEAALHQTGANGLPRIERRCICGKGCYIT